MRVATAKAPRNNAVTVATRKLLISLSFRRSDQVLTRIDSVPIIQAGYVTHLGTGTYAAAEEARQRDVVTAVVREHVRMTVHRPDQVLTRHDTVDTRREHAVTWALRTQAR